jgi:hypothetical protein
MGRGVERDPGGAQGLAITRPPSESPLKTLADSDMTG